MLESLGKLWGVLKQLIDEDILNDDSNLDYLIGISDPINRVSFNVFPKTEQFIANLFLSVNQLLTI